MICSTENCALCMQYSVVTQMFLWVGYIQVRFYGGVSEVFRKNKKGGVLSSQMITSHDNTR